MSGYRRRKLDPTALYAAVMTIACLFVSMYPAQARTEAPELASAVPSCAARGALPTSNAFDSVSVGLRAAVLGRAPGMETAGR